MACKSDCLIDSFIFTHSDELEPWNTVKNKPRLCLHGDYLLLMEIPTRTNANATSHSSAYSSLVFNTLFEYEIQKIIENELKYEYILVKNFEICVCCFHNIHFPITFWRPLEHPWVDDLIYISSTNHRPRPDLDFRLSWYDMQAKNNFYISKLLGKQNQNNNIWNSNFNDHKWFHWNMVMFVHLCDIHGYV